MRIAVFGDAHAHAEALDAVIAAAERAGVDALWSLGDMIGGGPDPAYVVRVTRERCLLALMGNHDYAATGSVDPSRLGGATRSLELAREALGEDDLAWMRGRRPAARRADVECWHGGPRNPVWEFVGPSNADACLARQKASLGLVAHTHVAAAFTPGRRVKVRVGEPLDLRGGKWLLNPGAVGARVPPRRGWFAALDAEAADGAFWLELDLAAQLATWRRAPYDPRPGRLRARALGIDDP
ncbi:metallophosphoesterase family protein [Solirubrobacter sp. CPCC 204708]|uniref:Metallophosphatase family protein n=1 Tax=Solirubrobacter deserti TaxID=2282478 RepID=A0ABT4RJP1_9ACTN|nr:metallophosphoesterase family protein [Solirubrobacter deserti]MBE2319747.1 metallophosphoesterase family protein [Solirubrobacter deserti]MDA0138772.1 metallophosphatase family protein [Solirubrobacter deserti]